MFEVTIQMKNKDEFLSLVKKIRKGTVIVFLMVLGTVFLILLQHLVSVNDFSTNSVVNYLKGGFDHREESIKLYGGVQKIAGKRAIESFTIFKDYNGKLQQPRPDVDESTENQELKAIQPIIRHCSSSGIQFLYITSLLPLQNEEMLSYSGLDFTHERAASLQLLLNKKNIPYFDLRKSEFVKNIPIDSLFFRTDHHWTMRTAYASFQATMDQLGIVSPYTDIEMYDVIMYPDAFLGSYGVKVEEYYAGRDDFVVFVPKGNGSFIFEAYDSNDQSVLSKQGDWLETLMDLDILNDPNYDNKYLNFRTELFSPGFR